MIMDDRVPGLAELLGLGGLTHLRYKPGTSCVAGLRLDDGDGFGYAVSAAARPKLDKIIRRSGPGEVLVHDRDRKLIIARAAADRDLPALADPAAALAGILPGPTPTLRTLAYKPQRRWVGLARRDQGPPVVLRAYRRSMAGDAHHRLTWYGRLTGARRSLGWDSESGLIATSFQPGTSLAELIQRGEADDGLLRDCGAALARLHDHPPVPGPSVRRADPAANVALITTLLPAHERRARGILDRLHRTAPPASVPVPCHGDFSADQVIIDADRAACMIDFDRAGLGDPAADLAGLAASGLGPESVQCVLDGYRSVRPVPGDLGWQTARALLLRAAEPFRSGSVDWPERIPERLSRVEEELR